MRLIFLDIDGVLNNRISMEKGKLHAVHEPCVINLNKICEQTNAVCVVSSVWRLGWPLPALQKFLEEHGFTGKIVDKTPNLPDEERGVEIAAYLEKCRAHYLDIESWVILDDDSDMGPLEPFLVQTDNAEGLTETDTNRAIEILNGLCKAQISVVS